MKKKLFMILPTLIVVAFVFVDHDASGKTTKYTFSGSSYYDTDSFILKAGTAIMAVTIPPTQVGHYSAFYIEPEDQDSNEKFEIIGANLVVQNKNGGVESSGKTTIRKLRGGKYYIRVISGVDWNIIVTQE